MDGCRTVEKVILNNQSIYKFGLSGCLFVCLSAYLPTGYQDIFAYSVPLRLSGPAVRTIAFTVRLSGTKNGCQDLFVSCQRNKTQSKPTHLQGLAKMFLYRFDFTLLKLNVTYNDSNIKISFIQLIRITIDWVMIIIKIIRIIIIDIVCLL